MTINMNEVGQYNNLSEQDLNTLTRYAQPYLGNCPTCGRCPTCNRPYNQFPMNLPSTIWC